MKINEVEALVGITKKNIRFYEEQGLLSPRRNSENGYRDYGQEEVDTLRQIKLLRKLGVPLEEIRRMQAGRITVVYGTVPLPEEPGGAAGRAGCRILAGGDGADGTGGLHLPG